VLRRKYLGARAFQVAHVVDDASTLRRAMQQETA